RLPDVRIDNTQPWWDKHWKSLETFYARAPYFDAYAGGYRRPLRGERGGTVFDLKPPLARPPPRDFALAPPKYTPPSARGLCGVGSDLIREICARTDATVYLSGANGRQYLREDDFSRAGIAVFYQDYRHPVYAQLHGPFVPYMAAVDLLFNCGPGSFDMLMS